MVFDEIPCYVNCAQQSGYFNIVLLLVLFVVFLLAFRRELKSPKSRLLTFASSQVIALIALLVLFLSLECDNPLYAMIIYLTYVLLLTFLTLLMPRFYDRVLIRYLRAGRISEVMDWPQGFVDEFSSGKGVYWYDSAVPKAFASGRSIFLSMGLLELLEDCELRAVLAHETWHLSHNSKTPLLRQLALMTFVSPRNCQMDLEKLADEFAIGVAGDKALKSAYRKLQSQ